MRLVAMLLMTLAACARPTGGGATVPDPSGPAPLPAVGLRVAGEQMVWEVFWQGFSIGRANLAVAANETHITFATGRLARTVANVHYALTTTFDHGVPRTALEEIAVPGSVERIDLALDGAHYAVNGARGDVPGATALHTLGSALGAIRAWVARDAARAYAWVMIDGELYRLDVSPPVRDSLDGVAALRVEGLVRALDPAGDSVELTVWLADRADRTPLRIAVMARGERVVAQLAESTAP